MRGLPANAELQAAIALDDALDHLAKPAAPSLENGRPIADSRDGHLTVEDVQPLHEIAKNLTRLNTAQPDKRFAATLRNSLLTSATAPVPPASSAPVPANLGFQPALSPMHRGQYRPTPQSRRC